MKWIVAAFLTTLVMLIVAMAWQHDRYVDLRRNAVQDNQQVFHGRSFHAITYLHLDESADATGAPATLLRRIADLKAAAEHNGEGTWIYAGKALYNGLQSTQITAALGQRVPWHAIIVQEFADRSAYDRYLMDPSVQGALERFPTRYVHGMERSAVTSALLPQLLLARRLWRAVTLAPPLYPLEPMEGANAQFSAARAALSTHAEGLGRDAILIINLMQQGSAEQEAANASYASRMLDLMAERSHGPMHLGAAVAINPEVQFTQVAMVYYPGSRYFSELIASQYFQSIIGDKQLADTEAVITVPLNRALKNLTSS